MQRRKGENVNAKRDRLEPVIRFAIGQTVGVHPHQIGVILDELADVWALQILTYGELSAYIMKAQKKIYEESTSPEDKEVTPPEDKEVTSPEDKVVTSPEDKVVTLYDLLETQFETQEIPLRIREILAVWSPGAQGEITTGDSQKESKKEVRRISIRFGIHDHDRVFYAFEDGHYEVHKIEHAGRGFL